MLGMHGNYAPNIMEQECDVLIAIGMRFSDRVTGNLKTYAKQAKIIHLDIDVSEIDKNVKTDVAVVADCKVSLPAITKLINTADHKQWRDSFVPLQEKEMAKVIEPAIHPKKGPLLMGEVVNVVAEATKGEAVLVTDVGQNQLFSTRYFKFLRNRSLCTSGGLGTMGYGMPAAIGASFGAPERTICCFMGDGGFQMCIQELGTIMEQQVPVKMILLNNNYLGNVRQWQDMFWNKRKSFTRMLNPSYMYIAKGYGIPYEVVIEREHLKEAVEKMLTTPGPYILECAILEEDDVLPMTPPGLNVDDMMLEIHNY
jgi:acetolactate synthase-1/2/3 large subunit